ncbi:MAG: hypothetical protein KY476_23945 [Planctomycetes bacterium]|nr:hypothetical protein [Planctomycetota bacterium]
MRRGGKTETFIAAYVRGERDVTTIGIGLSGAMTEANWLGYADPAPMLEFARRWRPERSKAGRRKLRLYACAVCRPHWRALSDTSRRVVEITERYADGIADKREFGAAQRMAAYDFGGPPAKSFAEGIARYTFDGAMNWLTSSAAIAAYCTGRHFEVLAFRESIKKRNEELARQAVLLREIFGNPFQPIVLDKRWLSSSAVHLAREIYEAQTFDRMAKLAAVLESSGCNHPAILEHCRGNSQHVRGCWSVDLLMSRAFILPKGFILSGGDAKSETGIIAR